MVREFKQRLDIDNTGLEELTFKQVLEGADKGGQRPDDFLINTLATTQKTGEITNELGINSPQTSVEKARNAEFDKILAQLNNEPSTAGNHSLPFNITRSSGIEVS